ncbi:unnamed protein product [Adineta steineri]|uniref:Uncharacterized protein n=1 Tax=Adineta steineri TaxID=433720 RepID=A0A819ST69_9BILA|nr:unnamed protein product [Adineta steineri]CAF4066249.1 unnamed protein product [Adineta steineri]
MATNSIKLDDTSISYVTLSQAYTQVMLNDKEFQLKTFLWRDFMPTIVPNNYVEKSTIPGSHLIAKLRISTVDNSEFPVEVKAYQVWIILNETQIWNTSNIEEQPRSSTNQVLTITIRNGPKWGPKVTVDVVVQLINTDGKTVLLQAKQQTIGCTS